MRLAASCIAAFVGSLPIAGPRALAQGEGTPPSRISERITGIGDDWRRSFALGCELAAAPGEGGWTALREAWPEIESHIVKQQLVKAWHFEPPAPFRLRLHPHVFDVFVLALEDDPEVAAWAVSYMGTYAWRAMKNSEDARAWLDGSGDASPGATLEKTMRDWVEALSEREGAAAVAVAERIAHAGHPFRRNPELVKTGRGLGIDGVLEGWLEDERLSPDARDATYIQLIEFDPQRYTLDGLRERVRLIEAERRREMEFAVRMIDDDPRKRWLLHGPTPGAASSPGGRGLLIVIPGGDGSIAFTPFVRDTIARSAGGGYLVAQLIAPPIESDDDGAVVWPTEGLRDDRVDFTMEPVVLAIIAQLREEHSIDSKRIFTLGWSSGGPPAYRLAMLKDSPVRGAFVAMSVFKPGQLPDPSGAAGRSFYLLHSPDDFIAMRFPETARRTLEEAGARVTLETYEGGHGWHGDVDGQIRRAVRWLEPR